MPGVAHRVVEAEIGHHGDHHGVAGQLAGPLELRREHGEDLVAVERLAVAVHRQAAVGVAVEGEARVGAVLDDRRRQRLQVSGADARVDVVAVGRGADRDDLGAGPAQGARADAVGGAVRAVHDDSQPLQRRMARRRRVQGGEQVVEVGLVGGVGVGHPAEPGRGRLPGIRARRAVAHGVQRGLDLVFGLVGQLDAAAAEELDPVVRGRVMARGQDDAEIGVERAGQVCDAGSRDDAEPEHVHPGAREPGDDGRLKEIARGPGVATDDRDRADARHRTGPRRVPVQAPPRPPGPWQAGPSGRSQRPHAHRQYRRVGPCRSIRVPATASAWSTEAPCGPS